MSCCVLSASRSSFGCPEQPNLKLPFSRVNDGVCDCCDGADEPKGLCTDICGEVLREEREARQKLERNFAVGHNKRKNDLLAFKTLREEKLKDVEGLEIEVSSFQTDDISSQIDALKQNYMIQRMQAVKEVAQQYSGLFKGLKIEELEAFIIHACQLAGEMSEIDTSNCVALRLAGLDIGLSWDDDNYDGAERVEVKDEITQDMASLLFENASGGSPRWTSGNGGRRRLMEEDHDYHGDYVGEYHDDDSYPTEDEDYDSDSGSAYEPKSHTADLEGKEKDMVEGIQTFDFSKTRMSFLSRSNEIYEGITKILDAIKDEEDGEGEGEGESTGETAGETNEERKEEVPSIDPAAYNMVRASLRRKEGTIVKGLRWAASAQLFFDIAPESDDPESFRLVQLALGTLYHGNLSAAQVWQILQFVVSEFPKPEIAPETCASPWAGFCPPQSIREGTYPPSYIIEAAESFCSQQEGAAVESVCGTESEEIPLSIPDGYYGYSPAVPRGDDDPLASFFTPVESVIADREGLKSLESEKAQKEKEKKKLEKQIENTWKDIGGKDGDGMGHNGELHSLADECFEVKAGKYIYELCIFGKAKQREGDAKAGGTHLGSWSKMETDEDSGDRVLYWENGAKCWNGPQRSATAYVTCGAETKIFSADEPDTCRYVLQMESHIACDEAFKERNGLQ